MWLAATLTASDRYQASEPHMGTIATITLYADSPDLAQQAFVTGFGRIAELNRILSDYDPQSELSRICEVQAPLSHELTTVLTFGQRLSHDSEGAFDLTVGPLSAIWREARRQKRLPPAERIEAALAQTGYRYLEL
ncbi:MAG: FAD:protein FMN transferase, partial [Bryobacteraceae bacterium]